MNLAIVGYGKMGKAVERIALERGHTVRVFSPVSQISDLKPDIACVIEFTHAQVAPMLIRACIDAGRPVVSGTTGWDQSRAEVVDYCHTKKGSLLWSPNFSIGMHIVFEMNKKLAQLMNNRPEYDVEILECHHTEKKDKPSGTAITLANQLISTLDRKTEWRLKEDKELDLHTLAVTAERMPDVKGIHRITYHGPYDVISLRHKALSRDAFALGAVIAAEWLIGKVGVFTFSDVLANAEK